MASLHFSLLAHESYCRVQEAVDINHEDLSAITTDDVNIHLTSDSSETTTYNTFITSKWYNH